MKKYLTLLWPFAAILVAVAIFFYPVWLQGKIPLPADFIVGTYYPWLDYKWAGYNAGVPVKNPITTDVVSFTYPIQMFSLDLMKKGIMPLWNNLILSGTPLLADFQSAPFSITNIFYFFLPKLLAWSLQIMIQPLLAALFLYFLLREFGLSKFSATAGGLCYAFAGFITIWMQWNGHSLVSAFFPIIFLLSFKWLKTSKLIWGILLSICLALQIFAGYPQIILYEIMGIILLIALNFNFKSFLGLGLFVLLGVGLASIQIIPSLELLKYSQREVEDVINVSAFLPWQYLITFLAPDFFGNHSTGNFWGEGDYTLVTGYIGVVVAVLAGIAAFQFKDKSIQFAGLLIGLSLLIALPTPLSLLLKESGLLGLQAASAHRALVLSNLGFVILVAFGLNRILLGKVSWQQALRAFYLPAVLLFGFAIGTYFSINWLKSVPPSPPIDKALINFSVGIRNLILPIGILFISAILVFLSLRLVKFRRIFTNLLFILAIFELFRFGWKFTPFSSREFVFPNTPVLDFLQSQPKPFRVAAEDVIPINMMMPYGIETVEGYDAVYPLLYAKYLAAMNSGQVGGDPMGRYGSVSNVNSKLFDLVNGKFVLVLKRDQNGKPDQNGSLPEKYELTKLNPVFEDKTVVVLENVSSLPRAFFISDWVVEKSGDKTLRNLLSEDFPINKKIIITEGVSFEKSDKNNALVKINGAQNFQVETDKSGFLFISQNFYPGWKARVDGIETKIFQADYSFQAIPIGKAGKYIVEVFYDPSSFRFGAGVSLLSLAVLCIIGVKSKYGKSQLQ